MDNKFCVLAELVNLIAQRVVAEYALPPGEVLNWTFDDGPISTPADEHLLAVARQNAAIAVLEMLDRGEITARNMTLMPVAPPVPFIDFDRRMIRRDEAELVLCRTFGAPALPAPEQAAATPAPVVAVGASGGAPMPRQAAQEARILQLLTSKGYDPLNLSNRQPGKPGAKSEIRAMALLERALFTEKTFNTAWQRLREDGRLAGGN